MTQGTMANIVQQNSQLQGLSQTFTGGIRTEFVFAKNIIKNKPGNVRRTDRMQIPVMGRSGKAEFGKSQLFNLPQALKCDRIDDRHLTIGNFYRTMNRIAYFHMSLLVGWIT